MPSDREIKLKRGGNIVSKETISSFIEVHEENHRLRDKLYKCRLALQAAEQERQEERSEPQDGDIGIDSAERLYKFLFNTWVAQGESSEPVYPVKIIARKTNGEYLPNPPIEVK
jgi:hypothetical protein